MTGTPPDPPSGQVAFNWREVQPIVGIMDWVRTGGAREKDMLEDAVDYCGGCGDEIPAGDYYCDDCC